MIDLLPIYLFGIPSTAAIVGFIMAREPVENPIGTLFFAALLWPVLLPWLLAEEVTNFWRARK